MCLLSVILSCENLPVVLCSHGRPASRSVNRSVGDQSFGRPVKIFIDTMLLPFKTKVSESAKRNLA